MNKKIFERAQDIAQYFAEYLLGKSLEHKQSGKVLNVALSGGTTPNIIFDLLRSDYRDKIEWDIIHFYWVDERFVPVSHFDSNFGNAKKILFDYLLISEENLHSIRTDLTIDESLHKYKNELKGLPTDVSGNPLIDIVILGMGSDGHTASIFSHDLNLFDSSELCEKVLHPDSGQQRITITGRVINSAKSILIIVTGYSKAETLRTVFDEKNESFPISKVSNDDKKTMWLVDKEAASKL